MKTALAISAIAVAATLGSPTIAAAQQDLPYCLRSDDGKNLNCGFETLAQCQDAVRNGPSRSGTCVPNPGPGRR